MLGYKARNFYRNTIKVKRATTQSQQRNAKTTTTITTATTNRKNTSEIITKIFFLHYSSEVFNKVLHIRKINHKERERERDRNEGRGRVGLWGCCLIEAKLCESFLLNYYKLCLISCGKNAVETLNIFES